MLRIYFGARSARRLPGLPTQLERPRRCQATPDGAGVDDQDVRFSVAPATASGCSRPGRPDPPRRRRHRRRREHDPPGGRRRGRSFHREAGPGLLAECRSDRRLPHRRGPHHRWVPTACPPRHPDRVPVYQGGHDGEAQRLRGASQRRSGWPPGPGSATSPSPASPPAPTTSRNRSLRNLRRGRHRMAHRPSAPRVSQPCCFGAEDAALYQARLPTPRT